jgi:hypothetical protein
MTRAGRLAGAILLETDGAYFLVGNTKRPCDWAAAGFEPPGELDARVRPFVRLGRSGPVDARGPWLELGTGGEEAAAMLAARFLIERNGSVSDRLWRLVTGAGGEGPEPAGAESAVIDARWLGAMPPAIWEIVRETVLKCT